MIELQALLNPLGLEVASVRDAPQGLHPVWVDLGYIREGAGEALALDQHAWWRRTAEAAGGAWGLAASAWTMGGMGASSEMVATSMRLAEQFSYGLSRVLGTYREVLVATPNVIASRSGGGPYAFVLGMYTDSPVAVWGDRALRYGYQKRFCQLDGRPFRTFSGRDSAGKTLLNAEITILQSESWKPARSVPGLSTQLRLLSQPLLGRLGPHRFALSLLERDYLDQEHALAIPSRVALQVAPALIAGLPAASCTTEPIGSESPWGSFSVSNVATRVSYPQHVSVTDL